MPSSATAGLEHTKAHVSARAKNLFIQYDSSHQEYENRMDLRNGVGQSLTIRRAKPGWQKPQALPEDVKTRQNPFEITHPKLQTGRL